MCLWPTQGDEKRLCPATTFYGTVALSFVISTEATRISCHAALDMTTCAAFFKESRMKFANATKLNRKSGVAQWRDLCVDGPSWKCFSTEPSGVERSAVSFCVLAQTL
jgi:hypothetical protein